ncbi:MAG: sulfite exporter TauE/SafE family protein [Chitinophagaceae bacterium]|jgi:uncharacterized membrane protein YfcA|nr:sulfite exporter TauE/SafE family protein [Chitinophagaceae bacterium]
MELLFKLLIFIVAFLYAMVGHGGASGYLALMAIFNMTPALMKPTALLLNLFVSLTAFIQFYRNGHFKWKIFLPFALASIPLSFLGGMITLDGNIYKKILGIFLIFPITRFLFYRNYTDEELKENNILGSIAIGGSIGFVSGLIGIGGGIILSPILLLLRWTNQKQTAAISAMFIFVNSLSGLIGQITKGISLNVSMFEFAGIAFVGGLLGSWLGAFKFNQQFLKYALAIVLAFASYKLLFTNA